MKETLVISHVTEAITSLVVTIGPVRVMGPGVATRPYAVKEVKSIMIHGHIHLAHMYSVF